MKLLVLILPLIVSCSHSGYPKSWWSEVSVESKKKWEVLPQSAKEGEVILSKRTELGVLSNFAATPFVLNGKKYASVEGFWQSLKYPEVGVSDDPRHGLAKWPHTREQVTQMVGFEAKRAGSQASEIMKKNGIHWVSHFGVKMMYREKGHSPFYNLIRQAMVAKIEQNKNVRDILVSTGDLKLLPDHKQETDLPKAWRYNEIYMELRSEYSIPWWKKIF